MKLCVGLVQDWITLELAISIHSSRGSSDISAAGKRKLRITGAVLFAAITLAFIAFATTVIVSAHKEGNHGIAYLHNHCFLNDIMGYSFLG